MFTTRRGSLSKAKFQNGIENEKRWEQGEESELQKCFDSEVIKPLILKSLLNAEDVVKTYCGRDKNVYSCLPDEKTTTKKQVNPRFWSGSDILF